MSTIQTDPLMQMETTCGSLLYELQIIWDEVGESDAERDKMLLELEQECLEVYRRKVDMANRCRAQLRRSIADSEAELAAICSAMGEPPIHIRQDVKGGSLKEELRAILPQLEEMRKRKSERRHQFIEVQEQIQKISNEIDAYAECMSSKPDVDESDLSVRRLEELHRQLQMLQKEKSDRLIMVMENLHTLNSLCSVLGMDFNHTVSEVHSSLCVSEGTKNISNHTIEQLAAAIQRLREVKIERMQRLQDLATTMLELWNLMDTPIEEQQMFQNVTCNVAASEHEITEPNTLSIDFINYVEAEVSRLEELKSSKMKELVLKKRSELEEICRKTHLVPEADNAVEYAIEAVECGAVDPACVLEQIELQISLVKEEAFSRKEILEKVEKWIAACEEESWLEEYNRDENRYNAGRGAHLTLKRAEKARALVNKLPAMVEALASKATLWEKERGTEFTYDGIRLLSMLEEYTILRQEKEQERRRQRDQKKLQGQLIAEQEALFGSKPSPSKPQSVKKTGRVSTGGCGGGAASRRLSLGGAMLQTPKANNPPPYSRPARKNDRLSQNEHHINHHHDDGVAALSNGSRGLDIAGLPTKKQSFNVREIEPSSPMMRKPFSPILTKPSAATNLFEDLNRGINTTTSVPCTPSKTSILTDEENKTPKKAVPIPVPTTPSTVSVPMQTAVTPAPAQAPFGSNVVEEEGHEEIEYSFEEKRAGFMLNRLHLKSAIQVD